MPEPRAKFSPEEISAQFYQLSMIEEISSAGYTYRLDLDEHRCSVNHARNLYNSCQTEFEEGEITSEEHQEHYDMYLEALSKYVIVDEDGKICGEYYSNTKNYQMFCWRFVLEGMVYYYDDQQEVFTYTNSYVGRLTDDGRRIIRNVASSSDDSDSDSDSDSLYDDLEDEIFD